MDANNNKDMASEAALAVRGA